MVVFGEGIKVEGGMVGLDEGAEVVEVIDGVVVDFREGSRLEATAVGFGEGANEVPVFDGVVVDFDGNKLGTIEGDMVVLDGGKVGFEVVGLADGTKLVVCEGRIVEGDREFVL